ncbi:hypothetical protein A2960_05045 [Candidatus Gottesmanbacteria bacterium RIFCSPLOWO2_01_FULL_39_12b]|uniref:Vitamin K epoxide reductase domain-containing protein n=1 Tax=Candidatus Gottesmanbacteria bacterium RIFCSPLOWO2_01_FULL_39_12b TaxID=1798388 RepID=A0A1F6ALY8_9BACT|nr:MAG: hypothetical protein A2960_05045 [Candidatus Gottesmanbacteria bacterium RIFCSPLOWO2_01_FULL_39_12b]
MKDKSNSLLKLNRIIFVLAIIGLIIAVYVLQGFLRQAPIVCINTGCEQVRKSASSYIFGIPVPAFGLVGYSLITILAFLRTFSTGKSLLYAILGIASFGFLFVGWFTYTEIFVINATCTWCAISAVIMTVIFILSVKSYMLLKK